MNSSITPVPAGQPIGYKAFPAQSWRYDGSGRTRDLRIDFLRGIVFVLLFTAHFNFFSWFALVGWERIGVVSSAEMFILLAGVVTGSVYGKKLKTEGLDECTIKLFKRALTLYKTAILAAGIVAVLRLVPWIDMTSLITFVDPITEKAYPLYPDLSVGFLSNLFHVLALAAIPHQFQIVGLYVILFLLTPIIFWAIANKHTGMLLTLSWVCYAVNYMYPEKEAGTAAIRVTVAQFEYAFPIMAWQLIFVHGVVIGYYRNAILEFFNTWQGKLLIVLCAILSVSLIVFSFNHPLEQMPSWAKLELIDPNVFTAAYQNYFLKYKLGPGRVLNLAVLFVASMALLTIAWKPIHKALGWFFIPLGQESMYVFFVHLFLILIVYNTPLPFTNNVWVSTGIHGGAILLTWLMVKTCFLFKWIPR